MAKTTVVFYVEGHTEKKLLEALRVIGPVKLINLWDVLVEKYIRRLSPGQKVCVICDTDTQHASVNVSRFHYNISWLEGGGRLYGWLQQTGNLEDELVRCCEHFTKHGHLYQHFDACSASEFKSQFLATRNLGVRLDDAGLAPHGLWSELTHPTLKLLEDCRLFFKDLPVRRS